MDLQDRVAARRAELERQRQEAELVIAAQQRAARDAEEADRLAQLNVKTEEIFQAIASRTEPSGDAVSAGIISSKAPSEHELEQLLRSEARKRWSTADRWAAFGPFFFGLALLTVSLPFGFVVAAAGFWRWTDTNRKYEQLL